MNRQTSRGHDDGLEEGAGEINRERQRVKRGAYWTNCKQISAVICLITKRNSLTWTLRAKHTRHSGEVRRERAGGNEIRKVDVRKNKEKTDVWLFRQLRDHASQGSRIRISCLPGASKVPCQASRSGNSLVNLSKWCKESNYFDNQ